MRQQHFEESNARIRSQFAELRRSSPEKVKTRLKLSWSNWASAGNRWPTQPRGCRSSMCLTSSCTATTTAPI
jgi:hypothetical protein